MVVFFAVLLVVAQGVAVQNIGGKFFHTMGRVSVISTSSSPLTSEGKTNTRLGASVGIGLMH